MLKQMKLVLGATAVAGVFSLVGATGVAPSATMQVSPSTVTPGGEFTVSNADGAECPGVVKGSHNLHPGSAFTVEPDDAGDWSKTIPVPEHGTPTAMGEETPFPPGEYEVVARCELIHLTGFAGQQAEGFDYEPVTVTVVAQPAPTTTTTTPAGPAPVPAPAAVAAAPTYTG